MTKGACESSGSRSDIKDAVIVRAAHTALQNMQDSLDPARNNSGFAAHAPPRDNLHGETSTTRSAFL